MAAPHAAAAGILARAAAVLASRPARLAAGAALVGLLAAAVLRAAWLADDAYITFRTVDNFIHGHGLRWNVAERVQTYTHPLWLLVIAALYAGTREIYLTVITLSVGLTLAAAGLLAARLGVLLLARGDAAAGEAALRRAVALRPPLLQAYQALARHLARSGRETEARALLEELARASPPDGAAAPASAPDPRP